MEKLEFKVNLEMQGCGSNRCKKSHFWSRAESKLVKTEVALCFLYFGFILWTNVSLVLVFIYPSVWYKNFPVF